MPRATTKEELLTTAATQWDKMWKMIDAIGADARTTAFAFDEGFLQSQKEAHWRRDKNLRDVLVHLYEWHRLLLGWTASNLGGETRPFLPEPYNWKTCAQMNVGFWETHQATPYAEAKELLCDSHARVMELIRRFSDAELFEKKHFSWTGTTTLGSYCISATASHYDWAVKKIRQHAKTVEKTK